MAVVLVLAGCVHVPPPGDRVHHLGQAHSATLDDPIRVLVWNIYKSSRSDWSRDFSRLVGSHSLVLLQEGVWNADFKPTYAGADGIAWALGVTFEQGSGADVTMNGTVIGGRAALGPISFEHSRYFEPVVGTPKSYISATFAVAGSDAPLLAISMHAINFRLESWPFEDHVDQVFEVIVAHHGPVILAGDFNTWSEARTEYLFSRSSAHHLAAVYPRAPAEEGDGRATFCDNYLDHAFVRELEVVGAPRVLKELTSSDHSALSFAVTSRAQPPSVTAPRK
jgi:endonuclease/exonuclease/phosphatase (EEP) superfamily protein YafD